MCFVVLVSCRVSVAAMPLGWCCRSILPCPRGVSGRRRFLRYCLLGGVFAKPFVCWEPIAHCSLGHQVGTFIPSTRYYGQYCYSLLLSRSKFTASVLASCLWPWARSKRYERACVPHADIKLHSGNTWALSIRSAVAVPSRPGVEWRVDVLNLKQAFVSSQPICPRSLTLLASLRQSPLSCLMFSHDVIYCYLYMYGKYQVSILCVQSLYIIHPPPRART